MPENIAKKKGPKHDLEQSSKPSEMSNTPKRPRKASEGDKDMQRERKRATDRQAQRMARERTKQYITHLEKTIEILRQESGSEAINRLLSERNQLALEVQKYRKVLCGMRLTIDSAVSGEPLIEPKVQAGSTNGSDDSEEATTIVRQDVNECPISTSWSDPAMFRGLRWEEMGMSSQSNNVSTVHDDLGLITLGFDPNSSTNPAIMGSYPVSNNSFGIRSTQHESTLPTNFTSSWTSLPRLIPQSISPVISPLRGHSWNDRWWQTANQSYERIFTVGPYGSQAADLIFAGTLVKAVRDGWDSLDMRDQNNPVLTILREMDEKVFFQKDKVSRVALAVKSHRLMKYYLNADRSNLLELADWQRPRASQRAYKHPIAIDFFAWPGLRDRMVKHHAQYFQTTEFSESYRKHFIFSWPFKFEDSYIYDEGNDAYHLSPLFEKYHRDLASWRFEETFFKRYPELLDAVKFVEPDHSSTNVTERLEAPAVTRARNNSTAMMAATGDFPEVPSAMGEGVNRTMMAAEAESPNYGERRSVHEPLPIPRSNRRNMSMAEQVGVEGLADLWMTT